MMMNCEEYLKQVFAALKRQQEDIQLQVELERQIFLQDLQDSMNCVWESHDRH
jgi:hypothetical protein